MDMKGELSEDWGHFGAGTPPICLFTRCPKLILEKMKRVRRAMWQNDAKSFTTLRGQVIERVRRVMERFRLDQVFGHDEEAGIEEDDSKEISLD